MIKLLSHTVKSRCDRSDPMLMRVAEMTPVLQRKDQTFVAQGALMNDAVLLVAK